MVEDVEEGIEDFDEAKEIAEIWLIMTDLQLV